MNERDTTVVSAWIVLSLTLWASVGQGRTSMSVLHSNDFEDGATVASYGYTRLGSVENTSGAGMNGSTYGVRTSGAVYDPTDESFTVDEAIWDAAPSGRLGRVSGRWRNDWLVDSGGTAHTGSAIIQIKSQKLVPLSYGETAFFIRKNVDANLLGISLCNRADVWGGTGVPDGTYSNAYTADVPVWIRADYQWSTVTGGTINSDGWIKVYVDGTLRISTENVPVGFPAGPSRVWGQVEIITMGDFDDLCIRDDHDSECFAVAASSGRNLLTGSTHTVQGSDNLIAGANGTVTGDRNVLFSLRQD